MYKIEVKKITKESIEEQKYPKEETIYEQLVETLELKKVIDAVNSI